MIVGYPISTKLDYLKSCYSTNKIFEMNAWNKQKKNEKQKQNKEKMIVYKLFRLFTSLYVNRVNT